MKRRILIIGGPAAAPLGGFRWPAWAGSAARVAALLALALAGAAALLAVHQ
jgi:hypothetical protein